MDLQVDVQSHDDGSMIGLCVWWRVGPSWIALRPDATFASADDDGGTGTTRRGSLATMSYRCWYRWIHRSPLRRRRSPFDLVISNLWEIVKRVSRNYYQEIRSDAFENKNRLFLLRRTKEFLYLMTSAMLGSTKKKEASK